SRSQTSLKKLITSDLLTRVPCSYRYSFRRWLPGSFWNGPGSNSARSACPFTRRSRTHSQPTSSTGSTSSQLFPRQSFLAVAVQKTSPGCRSRRFSLDLERGSISSGGVGGQRRVLRELVDLLLDPQEPCRIAPRVLPRPANEGRRMAELD